MRVGLKIQRTLDLEVAQAQRRQFLCRLLARVRLQQFRGWSEPHAAIIDTGAPYSLIPSTLWPSLKTHRILDLSIRGIVPGETAEMQATMATIRVKLLGAMHASRPLTLWAMLATHDRVPLILGWAGLLDRAKLVIDAPRHAAWLEF